MLRLNPQKVNRPKNSRTSTYPGKSKKAKKIPVVIPTRTTASTTSPAQAAKLLSQAAEAAKILPSQLTSSAKPFTPIKLTDEPSIPTSVNIPSAPIPPTSTSILLEPIPATIPTEAPSVPKPSRKRKLILDSPSPETEEPVTIAPLLVTSIIPSAPPTSSAPSAITDSDLQLTDVLTSEEVRIRDVHAYHQSLETHAREYVHNHFPSLDTVSLPHFNQTVSLLTYTPVKSAHWSFVHDTLVVEQLDALRTAEDELQQIFGISNLWDTIHNFDLCVISYLQANNIFMAE